jgi:uncharacterized membrane protein
MTEPLASDAPVPRSPLATDEKLMPIVVYVLYLLGWAGGVTALVGFLMAYALKERAPDWVRTHYVFLIRTVWIGLIWAVAAGLLIVLGLPLTLVLIGFLFLKIAFGLLGLLSVWVTVRCVVGLIYAARCEPYPRPQAWII